MYVRMYRVRLTQARGARVIVDSSRRFSFSLSLPPFPSTSLDIADFSTIPEIVDFSRLFSIL